ncbi:SDR family NAD(P)-dependent oxidoreductase [Rufibacter latericius]|uniref:SDR family NAD(P)-dependent oxidoreductase n=1 Tax=Rufibacter latericius TaxID=2487040 RepID=A0A3M9MBW0_9BACT|nr:SDR family NAD(P)-dependent oxidoreductase [Rufibacter latericius]RNI22665.1 SDR family NAD(P)-dependent oxidoreductase [Rufibacter latericius]
MENQDKVWLITGAGRGLGVDIAKAALAAGFKVVATGRDINKVAKAIGESENLFVVKLDVTSLSDAEVAVKAAVDKFGTVDVLVNNAANFYAGFFEELSPRQIELQITTNVFGPMNVTRAVLPVMRKNRSGHIISLSSIAGLVGTEYTSAYNASKFALEGWMESLQLEVAPFGIKTTIVEPGYFRTELLEPASTTWPEKSVEDYAERSVMLRSAFEGVNGKQPGDPAKLADALIKISSQNEPPKRWLAGTDAIRDAEKKISELQQQINAYRDLSSSLAYVEE